MKRFLLALGLILLSTPALASATLYSDPANGNVGIGTNSPTTGAALDLSYNSNSVLLPVGTTGQRPSGVNGMMRLNTDTPGVEAYYGGVWNSLAVSGGVQSVTVQTFSTSGTFTPDAGLVDAEIICLGGGAGGGGVGTPAGGGGAGGGGAGGYSIKFASAATIGASQTVTIGAAGSGASAGANSGGNGGDTSVGTLCVGKGGSGGATSPTTSSTTPNGGAGGVAGTGDITGTGMSGSSGSAPGGTAGVGQFSGSGGSSAYGGGGAGVPIYWTTSAAGVAGTGYGSGGSGAVTGAQTPASEAGGAGTAGYVAVIEFRN